MAKKTRHPLRAKLESFAFVWYIILNLIGIAFVYSFQNWPMCVAIFILSHFVIGFCAVASMRLLLGKEQYALMVIGIASEDELAHWPAAEHAD
jgi:hypothetical protein